MSAIRKRTFGVGAITLLLLLLGGVIAVYTWRGEVFLPWDLPAWLADKAAARVVGYATALLFVLVAAGMWSLRRPAWIATMLLVGTLMLIELVGYTRGTPQYPLMALSVLLVFYLNQRSVQERFVRRFTRAA